MAKSIMIERTKGIRKLEFVFPDRKSVYLLVGSNGTGKTTLLTCIDRICNPFAFARGFLQPKNTSGFDEYQNASIKYITDDICVAFRKGSARWVPSPRTGSIALLREFGYTSSIFIKADSKRIDATAEEIKSGTIRPAESWKIETMNRIFETTKYSNMRQLRITHGRGRPAYSINIIKDGNLYYTEKRFSTGEIAILRLVEKIHAAEKGAVVLLDEAEIALHPRVQINLLHYLQEKAREKELMVFISTHSPTMIKATRPCDIILLESRSLGIIEPINPCYPAMAVGRIDFEETNTFDYVFFVEDEMARFYLKRMIFRYRQLAERHNTVLSSIIPVGGYYETARMAVTTRNQLFGYSKVFAFVDADAFDDLDRKPLFSDLYSKHSSIIKSLSITPEVRFIEVLQQANDGLSLQFREAFHCEIYNILANEDYLSCTSPNPRYLAKKQFDVFVDKCISYSGDHEIIVKEKLINMIVDTIPDGEVHSLLGGIFSNQ